MSVPFLDLPAMHAEIWQDADRAWHEVSRAGAFIGGTFVERFESEWAARCGTRHCVGLASGTAALELTLAALGIGPGDEVIVPANTFVATAAAVATSGAEVVFVDVDPATLLVTADAVEAALTPRTAAVVVVHLYGQPVAIDPIRRAAGRAGIAVVEDAAQAHGATWNGRPAGSLGDVGCFSFYPGKNLGAFGDAGAVVTDDATLAARIRSLANHGRAAGDHHRHELRGGNHRLDGLQAALLSVKLRRLDAWTTGRRRAAEHYARHLDGLPLEPVAIAPGAASSHHLAVVQVPERDRVRAALTAAGIGTGVHYPVPCHLQPAFLTATPPRLPVAERAAGRVLSLPMSPHLDEGSIGRVAAALGRALDGSPAARRLAS